MYHLVTEFLLQMLVFRTYSILKVTLALQDIYVCLIPMAPERKSDLKVSHINIV